MHRTHLSHHTLCRQWHRLLLLGCLLLGAPTAADVAAPRRLAILVAAPWEGETAMHNDLVATYTALRQRGFSPEEFLVLEGVLTRSVFLAFLQDVQRRIGAWQQGEVWFSFSGHGTFRGTTVATARPGLLLTSRVPPSQEDQVFWDELFAVVQVPPTMLFILLPDA